jgi:hypothetical protein
MLLSTVQWQSVHRVHSDPDPVTARIYSFWNYGATNLAPAQKQRPLLRRKRGPFSKHIDVLERIKILVMGLEETDAKGDWAGEGQRRINQSTNQLKNRYREPTTWLHCSLRNCEYWDRITKESYNTLFHIWGHRLQDAYKRIFRN